VPTGTRKRPRSNVLEESGREWRGTYIEMVPPLLGREFAAFLDEVPELRLASLELATLVIGCYPIGDFVCCLLFISPSSPHEVLFGTHHFRNAVGGKKCSKDWS